MSRIKVAPLYESVIERNTQKTRYSSISVQKAFLVKEVGKPAPISITRQPGAVFQDAGDIGISLQVRLDGYALAPLRWFRDRGVDPVAMKDGAEYRETFFSIMRRHWHRWPEYWWRIKHPTGKRAIHVERVE